MSLFDIQMITALLVELIESDSVSLYLPVCCRVFEAIRKIYWRVWS